MIMQVLIGIPDWAAGIVFLAVWAVGMAIWHAVKLRRKLAQYEYDARSGNAGQA